MTDRVLHVQDDVVCGSLWRSRLLEDGVEVASAISLSQRQARKKMLRILARILEEDLTARYRP